MIKLREVENNHKMVRSAGIEQGSIILVYCGFIYFLDYFVSSFVSLFFKVLILAVFSLNLFKIEPCLALTPS